MLTHAGCWALSRGTWPVFRPADGHGGRDQGGGSTPAGARFVVVQDPSSVLWGVGGGVGGEVCLWLLP